MNKQKFVTPVLMWIIVIVGILISLKFVPNISLFKRDFFSIALFLMSIIYWIYFFFSSLYFHRQAAASAAKISKVIKIGPYSYLRHPIYSADIVLAIGFVLFFPSLNVLIAVAWLIIVLVFWMKLEEKALINIFGKEYLDYMKEVPMIIPMKYR